MLIEIIFNTGGFNWKPYKFKARKVMTYHFLWFSIWYHPKKGSII